MHDVFAAAAHGLMSDSWGVSRLCSGNLPKPVVAVAALVVAVDCSVAWLAQSTTAELTGGFFEAADCSSDRRLAALPD